MASGEKVTSGLLLVKYLFAGAKKPHIYVIIANDALSITSRTRSFGHSYVYVLLVSVAVESSQVDYC